MPLPLQQSPHFARAMRAFGADVTSDAPVIVHRQFGRTFRIGFASRIGVDQLDRAPRLINGEEDAPECYRAAGFRQIITPVHVAEWDLTRPNRRAAMHGKWRNRLHKGEAERLRIRQTHWDGSAHWLFRQADHQAKTRKYRGLATPLLAAFAVTNPKDALLFEAYAKGHPVAACLVLKHGQSATYQTAFSTALGHEVQAARVVMDAAARHLTERGVTTFDLGNVETDHARGLARFKLGTGAQLRRLGGTWIRLR